MFKIGEFSRISRTPVTKLRYYDEIGLFSPSYTDDENGYRYYKVEQLAELYRILALKDLGLGLDQIRRMTTEEVPAAEIRGMLNLKKAQLEQSIQEDIQRLKAVESRLRSLENGQAMDGIVMKSLPASHFISVRKSIPDACDSSYLLEQVHHLLPGKGGGTTYLTAIMHGEAFTDKDADMEVGYIMDKAGAVPPALPEGDVFQTGILPAVEKAATIVFTGSPYEGMDVYAALGRWIYDNGYQSSGPSREVYLSSPRGAGGASVVEIQWPVEIRPDHKIRY